MLFTKKKLATAIFSTVMPITLMFVNPAHAEDSKDKPGIGMGTPSATTSTALTSTTKQSVTKSATATKKLEGKAVPYCVWIDPSEWDVLDQKLNPLAEYNLAVKDGDAYAMVIPEKISVPLDKLADIIIQMAQTNGVEDPQIQVNEKRTVNGAEVAFLQWSGKIQGVKFIYMYNIYSGKDGTVQLVTFTTDEFFDKYKSKMENLLKGFCIEEKKAEEAPKPAAPVATPTAK